MVFCQTTKIWVPLGTFQMVVLHHTPLPPPSPQKRGDGGEVKKTMTS